MKKILTICFLLLFSFSFAQENGKEISEVEIQDSITSNKNYLEFKKHLKPNLLTEKDYKVTFEGVYTKDGKALRLNGSFKYNAMNLKMKQFSTNNNDSLKNMSQIFSQIIGLEYFYRNRFQDKLRCYSIGNNKWCFNLVNNIREKYKMKNVQHYFIVELTNIGSIKSIESFVNGDLDKYNEHHAITFYDETQKGIKISNMKVYSKNLKTENTIDVKLFFNKD